MKRARYRAWAYLLPELDAPEDYAGLTLTSKGSIGMVEEHASVRQAILLLLSTMPGERVMRPSYGCDLRKLLFSPNDASTQGMAIHYVRKALDRWEPRIDILRLDAGANSGEPGRLDVVVEYRLKSTRTEDRITFSMSLTGDDR